MATKKFKKYEYEDIRTDYLAFDSTDHKVQDSGVIPSRTLVEFDSDNKKLKVATTALSASNVNVSVFMLAQDVKASDYGIVYFVIKDINNLE